ncbi:hypothetical protein [Prevotella merdae]|uniref:hypothetical protein n=1 Tax=Prevotella merdae TaxID=2079531 RepID=UPI000D107569|nr:hypothetical protein [Prevotella merdae]
MNKYFLYAASALALASCSSDDFLGENSGNGQNALSAINFGGDAGKITRATSNTGNAAQMLDGQFRIYGVKKMGDTQLVSVFNEYSVWYVENKNTTTSNTDGWEYVGANGATNLGTGNITLTKDQTIKFWDYSAPEYYFIAGSPITCFSHTLTPGNKINSATIKGLAGHINANEAGQAITTNPVYIADPKVVKKADYQKPVQFSFKRQQAMVRVGLYETIPGYSITEINFYEAGGSKAKDGNNIILTSGKKDYFVGGNNISGTITYDWTNETPSYTYEYSETDLIKSQNWYAGKFEPHNALATVSTAAVAALYGKDNDMSTNGYFTVIPTPSATTAAPILIKCDYTLTSDDRSGETIKVTGATAAIPAAFSKWEANTRYTYLFKISQNTNGYTGNDPSKAGLYPITFDAVVKASTDAMQGTVTTVSTPSITTYQDGSVTDNGIEYKSGKAIKVTVTDANGKVQTLAAGGTAVGSVAVYKFTDAINEAEIQVKGTTGATAVTGEVTDNMFTFTPETEGYYAIQYLTTAATTEPEAPAAYAYKVVYVKAATK